MHSSSNFYNAIAYEYENYCKTSHVNHFLEEEIGLIKKYKPTSILELGIGDGRFARAYIKRNPNTFYVGIDNSENMIILAKDSGASLVLEDFTSYVEHMVCIGARFDCIVAPYTAIHHVKTEKQLELFENVKQIANTIIINCVTEEEEKKIFSNNDETKITFKLPDGHKVTTVIYKLHKSLRTSTQEAIKGDGRVSLVWLNK